MLEAGRIIRAAAVATGAALVIALPAALGAPAHTARTPQASAGSPQSRIRATLAELAVRDAALNHAAANAAVELRVAKRSLAVAQRNLGRRLIDLYKSSGTSPLAVLLGAQSLEDALAQLDDLKRAADEDRDWILRSRALRSSVTTLSRTIAVRQRSLAVLRASTQATAVALAARVAPVHHAATRQLAAVHVTPAAAVAPREPPTLTVVASAYALSGRTATGTPAGPGTVAVDPAVVALGTTLEIPGYGQAVASDTGSAIRGARIDLWFPTVEEARAWGTRTVTITIHRG